MQILTVNFYKKSGKHYAVAYIRTTDKEIRQLKAESKFGLNKIYDFIRANQTAVNMPDTFYWGVDFDGEEPLRFLKKPTAD